MKEVDKIKLRRFIGFSLCNAPGTVVELLVLYWLSEVVFGSHFLKFFIAPIVAFECAIMVDFNLFLRLVWRDNIKITSKKEYLKKFAQFNVSTVGVYGIRLLLIQTLNWIFSLNAVLCNLIAMTLSGLLNFSINDKIIFSKSDEHRPFVNLLMGLVHPFVSLKIKGENNIPDTTEPVVFVCNHGFFFGPIAASLNMPVSFRPWIDNRVLNIKECSEDVNRVLKKRFHLFGYKVHKKIIDKISHLVVAVMHDFNPIPVFKNGKREVVNTIRESVDTLMQGNNVLIFPERPRSEHSDIGTERKEASNLRNFYSGFAKIGQDFASKTGQGLRFIPVYINQKSRTMSIAPGITFQPLNNGKADRENFANQLHLALTQLESA